MYGTPVTADEVALAAVRQLHEAWLAAELNGDIEGVLALCTSDVRWLAPGSGMLVGMEAGRRLLTNTQVELQNIVASDLHVEISGELAYKTSRYETRYRLPGEGKLRLARGTHLWILRRERAEWRVALVTWQAER
jgi:ketosteroid isomerase-like protein